MAISVRGVNNAAGQNNGSTGTAASTVVVTAPGSLTNGDREFIAYVGTTSSVSLTANGTGWTLLGGAVSQISTGSVAAGGGSRWMAIWYRDKDASWSTQPTVGMASHAAPSMWVGAVAITPTSGSKFITPTYAPTIGASGLPNVTNYAGGPGPNGGPAFVNTTGGLIIAVTGTNDSVTSTNTSTAYAGVGAATYGTCTERCDGGTTTGNDVSGKIHTAPVTNGANPAYGTLTLSLSAATQAETAVIEQRELAGSSTPIGNVRESFDTGGFVGSDWYGGGNSFSNGEAVMGTFGAMENGVSGDYTIVGSSVFVQVKTASNAYAGLWSNIDSNQMRLCWFFNSGGTTAQAYAGTGVVGSSITHTSGTFYRVRESAGTVYWDYASNPAGTWTNQYSTALSSLPSTFFPNNVHVRFDAYSPGSLVIDNLNVAVYGTMGATLQKATFTAHAPFAKLETLTWDFTSSSADWDTSSAPSFALSGGQGVFSLPGFTVLPSEVISTFGYYDITGSYAQCQLVQAPLFSPGLGFAYPIVVTDDTIQVLWYVNGSGVATVVDTTGAEIATRTHTDGDYYRLRESGGLFYAEYGTSGSSWTTLITFSTGGMNLGQVYPIVGCYRIDTNPRTMKVDNFNVAGGATGTIAATLQRATAAITSAQAQSGAIAASALKALGALSGTHVENDYGTIAASALKPAAALSGAQAQSGSVVASALPATGALAGSQTQTGTIAATLQRAVSALTGDQPFTATVGATLQRAVSSLAGLQTQTGTVAATLERAVTSLVGVMQPSGSMVSTLQVGLANLAGSQTISGLIASALQKVLGGLTGATYSDASGTIAGSAIPTTVAATGAQLAKSETLVDGFDTGTLDLTQWYASAGTPTFTAGRLHLADASIATPAHYDLRDSYFMAELVDMGTGGSANNAVMCVWTPDFGGQFIGFYVMLGNLYAYSTQYGGFVTVSPYDPVAHRWLRIKGDSTGDAIVMEFSPDGFTWTNVYSGTSGGHYLGNNQLSLHGNTTAAGGSGEVLWDHVNLPPIAGSLSSSTQKPLSALTGEQPYQGNIVAAAQYPAAALAGAQTQSGSLSASAQRSLASLTGAMFGSGSITATAQRALAALTGSQDLLSTMSGTLQRATAALVGAMQPSGVIGSALRAATGSFVLSQTVTGTLAATLQRAVSALTGTQTGVGAMNAELQESTTNVVGTQTIPGMIVVALQRATADATDKFLGIAATARRALFSAILRIVTQTPRVAVVPFESRLATADVEPRLSVAVEDVRLAEVLAESRAVEVEMESRIMMAGMEDRSINLPGEDRNVLVQTESRDVTA